MSDHTCPTLTLRLPEGVDDLDRLHLKGLLAVLGKHAADGVEHHLGLGQVSGCALDEDVPGVKCDLWQGKRTWGTVVGKCLGPGDVRL